MRIFLLPVIAGVFISCSQSPRFELLSSKKTGITFNNTIVETDSFHIMSYEYIYNGGGVGIGDLNNDGLQDIIFAGNQVSPRVYLNTGNFKFKDITANLEGLTNDQWYSGITLVDINSDNLLDVYFTSTANTNPQKCKNRLWINQGTKEGADPLFKEMAEQYGIADDRQSVNAAFFDYDRDGDLDLYVLNNTVNQRMNTSYRIKITDGSAQNNDKLYRNNGDGTFTDVTIEAGIVFEGFGLGLALGDVNKDGYPDIYVSNDYISNDLLYINQGDGTFRNEIKKYMSYQTKSSMGNDMADINNDGNPDVFTLDMMPEYYFKKRQTINGFSYIFYVNDEKYGYEHQYLRNMLHLHNGFMNGEMLPYSEVAQMMGIYQTEWSWSPLFADYDNDGDKDLIIANGYPRDLTDKDWTRYKADVYGFLASEKQVIEKAPAVKVPNMAFENVGDLKFIKRTREWLPDVPSYSYGASFVDLDNDGDLDYVTNNINDKAFICRNNSREKSKDKSNYLSIRLIGKSGNTMGLGAKVELWSQGNYQFAEHFLTRGYASSVDPVMHFGLGKNAFVDSVRVTWPASNNISVMKNVAVNQIIDIDEAQSQPVVTDRRPGKVYTLLFKKRENLLNYVHEQADFIDFFGNQNIIPHKFSQIGPVMAQGDLNNDGQNDLVIGATNKLPTTVLLRKGSGFTGSGFTGLTTPKPFSESDLAIVDIDGDGDQDVVAVAGGYENNEEKEYQHFLYENRNGSFIRTLLPIPAFPASVVRPFDFDHDGDMDLFVGSRVKKGMFPYANHSWLVNNDKGKLSVTEASKLNLGMVTDAIWTDYDKDGWEDLLVAREWNSLVLLKNMKGKELVPQNIPALEDKHGIWYGLAAGDFDQDGDDDYIAGNLGDNHRFTVSDEYPMQLYAIDLDNDGNIDPLSTAYWKDQTDVMKEYPINYLDELWAQSTFFQKKYANYTDFSFSNVSEILDDNMLKRLEFKLRVNTTSTYIIWNDKGNLRWEKLPFPVQESPVRKMIVRDFNSDKYPDVLLAGNDYTYDVATGYYDANKGIVLLNKGKGMQGFDLLTPVKSGILLQGMVESLQYFEGDTALIVAGINRNQALVYKQVKH
jgi:enediyne biosynthesis protein E4